eukprot:gene4186-5237_t
MQSLVKGLCQSFTNLTVRQPLTSHILSKRGYALVLESIEIPDFGTKFHRPHRKQPTRERKRRVKREHQTKINRNLKKWQRNIRDWRLAPPQHLPDFQESFLKPKVDFKQRIDKFEDVPFGWRIRKHEKLVAQQKEDAAILKEIRQKRHQRLMEQQTRDKERREAFRVKMEQRKLDELQQQQ